MSKEPKFLTKRKRLTAYSFLCGYIELKSTKGREGDGIVTKLYRDCNAYFVQQYDFDKLERVFWQSYRTLKEARWQFDREPGKMIPNK